MGNHETMFLEFLDADFDDYWNAEWIQTDVNQVTTSSFISEPCQKQIGQIRSNADTNAYFTQIARIFKADIASHHSDLIRWLRSMPLYYETESQIFVHAGVDEEAGEDWRYGTSDEMFVSKFPATKGSFYKDIIAGHIIAAVLAKKDHCDVFYDGRSHFFIDGTTKDSGIVPVLRYNTTSGEYDSLHQGAWHRIVKREGKR